MNGAAIDHIGIAVAELAGRVEFWRDALGLPLSAIEVVEGERVRVAMLRAGDARIELLEATDPSSPIARHLDKRGEGIHHLTLRVDDIQAALARARAHGVEVLGDAPRDGAEGSRVAFLHPRSCGGVLVELCERPRAKAPAGKDVRPGEPVLAYLRDPQEKLFGLLRRLDGAGVTVEAIDLASFDDWLASAEQEGASAIGPSVLFIPMHRVERLLLDRPAGELPSLSERFERRVGRTVQEFLG
jgi:methylmalonyl-CoA/ethylmalonyl-CoA epimerase